MSNELKERVEQLISYYTAHSMTEFVNGTEERLKNFVTDDFSHLLKALEKEL